MEWTYTDGSGAVLLDTATGEGGAWTDQDPRIVTPVADGGTGITTIQFPKSRRARVAHVSVEPATPGTIGNFRNAVVADLDAVAGTCSIYFATHDGAALEDPESGSRGRLTLELEYN